MVCLCVCLLFVATNFHNFCSCARTSFATVFTFFHPSFRIFFLLFWYLSCYCFLFAFTLGFLATGLVFSAAPFVRRISRLFWDQQDREPIHEKKCVGFLLKLFFFLFRSFSCADLVIWLMMSVRSLLCHTGMAKSMAPNKRNCNNICVCWKSVIEPFFWEWCDGGMDSARDFYLLGESVL